MSGTERRSAPDWGRLIAAVGSPIALATALLFYFGWVRARFQARALGYDPGVLDLSVQDYLLKSINVLFLPVVLLVLAFLVFHQLHRHLIALAQREQRIRSALVRAGRLMVLSWPVWVVMAIIMFRFPPTYPVAIPVSLTVGAALTLYGQALVKQLDGGSPWSTTATTLAYLLLALGVFWDTERVARATGEAFARHIVAFPERLVAVTVYSEKRLEIRAAGTSETALGADSAYTFCYTGMRLLEGSRGRYVLLNEHGGHIIVLRETDDLRFEFLDVPHPKPPYC